MMLRICVISPGMPFQGGGAELRAFRHVHYLTNREDVDAFLVVGGREPLLEDATSQEVKILPVHLWIQDYHARQVYLQYLKLSLHILEIVIRLMLVLLKVRKQFEILHVIGAGQWFSLVAVYVGRLLKKIVVVEMVGYGADDPLHLNRRKASGKQLFPHRPLKYWLFLRANAYISKSQPITEAYRKAQLPEKKIYQIASAVDTEKFRPVKNPQEKSKIRKKLNLEAQDTALLFVGRICKQKGIHWLIPAMREIVKERHNIKLILLGPIMPIDRMYADEHLGKIETWELSKNIEYRGNVSNVDDFLKAADLFVLPTGNEGFSSAILEAMSCGLPIVTSDIPEIALSQIRNGVEGVLVPVGDVSLLAQTILDLLGDPQKMSRLGQAARCRVVNEFTIDIIGSQYIHLYSSLLSEFMSK